MHVLYFCAVLSCYDFGQDSLVKKCLNIYQSQGKLFEKI